MAELVVSKFDVHMLSEHALKILKFTVSHAQKNRLVDSQILPIDVFCRSAGLPILNTDELSALLIEACSASVVIETVDSTSPNRDDLPYLRFIVIMGFKMDRSNVEFYICNRVFEDELLIILKNIEY